MAVVADTLAELGLGERPRLVVLNKADALRGSDGERAREALAAELPAAVLTSARDGTGIDELRGRLAAAAARTWRRVRVRLPYSAGALLQRIRERGALHHADYGEGGIVIDAEVPPAFAAELERSGLETTARP